MTTASPPQQWIYKILPRDEWERAEKAGRFEGCGIDISDGFIHFSTAQQAVETAAKYFAGQTNLVLVAVDTTPLSATPTATSVLRWEASRGGELFPHLYAPLDTKKMVKWVKELPVGSDGNHQFPKLL